MQQVADSPVVSDGSVAMSPILIEEAMNSFKIEENNINDEDAKLPSNSVPMAYAIFEQEEQKVEQNE